MTLTDRADSPRVLEALRQTCELNEVMSQVNILPISWGIFSPELLELQSQDVVLASDCFYDSKGKSQ